MDDNTKELGETITGMVTIASIAMSALIIDGDMGTAVMGVCMAGIGAFVYHVWPTKTTIKEAVKNEVQ